jgi:hypothetical protein
MHALPLSPEMPSAYQLEKISPTRSLIYRCGGSTDKSFFGGVAKCGRIPKTPRLDPESEVALE